MAQFRTRGRPYKHCGRPQSISGTASADVLIDAFTAYAMLTVYDGLTQPESQTKFVQMLTTNPETMMKLADFCFSHVRAK
jgi:hypothetical protein